MDFLLAYKNILLISVRSKEIHRRWNWNWRISYFSGNFKI